MVLQIGRRVLFALLATAMAAGSLWMNVSNLDRLDFPGSLWRDKDDGPLEEARRWSRVRWALPERGVIGYVDEPITREGMSMACYALAPLRLDDNKDRRHAVVAVNAHNDARLTELAEAMGGQVTARSGDGLGVIDLGGATQP